MKSKACAEIWAIMFFHHYKATSHVSRSTLSFVETLTKETEINTIPENRIPWKSIDLDPIEFCAFGCLKTAIGKRHPKILHGLWKIVNEDWNNLSFAVLR